MEASEADMKPLISALTAAGYKLPTNFSEESDVPQELISRLQTKFENVLSELGLQNLEIAYFKLVPKKTPGLLLDKCVAAICCKKWPPECRLCNCTVTPADI